MRRLCFVLLVLAVLLCSAVAARAHGAAMTAILETEPHNLTPGQPVKISVSLFDVYNSPVPASRVRIQVEQDGQGQPRAFELREVVPGSYKGEITLAGAGLAILRVEATLPDGLWSGPLPVEPGPDGTKVWEMGVDLLHQDAVGGAGGAETPSPSRQPDSPFTTGLLRIGVPVAVLLVLAVAVSRLGRR